MIEVISTGSKGNAILYYYGEILVDVGLPYNRLKSALNRVKMIILTHIHGDHFNRSTIASICLNHPSVVWLVPEHLVEAFRPLIKPFTRAREVKLGKKYEIDKYVIEPFNLFHDVANFGYKLTMVDPKFFRIIHATDTSMIKHIDAKDFDIFAVECNYDQNVIDEHIRKMLYDETYTYQINSRENHLSFQKATEWFLQNAKPDSRLVPLHVSHSYDEPSILDILTSLLGDDINKVTLQKGRN